MEDLSCGSHRTRGRHGMMYGMLLESVQHYVQAGHGQDAWARVLGAANMQTLVFTTHKRYPDQTMLKLAQACSDVIGVHSHDGWMQYFGQCFVEYFTHYGYDKILRVSGRHFRDLLYGLDNLHETMRFSYLKMESPYFRVEEEDAGGCILRYTSKRVGFTNYVIGQLQHCGSKFYGVKVKVDIVTEEVTSNGSDIVYRLHFDNSPFCASQERITCRGIERYSNISGITFFRVFPFAIVFNKSLMVTYAGHSVRRVITPGQLIGQSVTQVFRLRRPLVDFNWANVLKCQCVVFELETIHPVKLNEGLSSRSSTDIDSASTITSDSSPDEQPPFSCRRPKNDATRRLLLKGQMRYIKDFDGVAFLCSPLLNTLEDMLELGLYITDLNMYDTSQDMVMAGSQRASALEYSIEKQREHSRKITENLEKLEEWREKSDSLLYSMIPKQIAVRLKQGEDPIKTCEIFDQVTILFGYLLGFDEMCAQLPPFQLVNCINSVFFVFDNVVDKHKVFKVETLGDAVYMVAGGVPDRTPHHAEIMARVALEFVGKVQHLSVPSNRQLQIRIGLHTGSVVAGVVGKRMPQYCLFGDTVNTASRMQTYGMSGLIHISESTQKCLNVSQFLTMLRGKLNVKGKGEMKTYWLVGNKSDPNTLIRRCLLKVEHSKSLAIQKDSPDSELRESTFQLAETQSSHSLAEAAPHMWHIGLPNSRSMYDVSRSGGIDTTPFPDFLGPKKTTGSGATEEGPKSHPASPGDMPPGLTAFLNAKSAHPSKSLPDIPQTGSQVGIENLSLPNHQSLRLKPCQIMPNHATPDPCASAIAASSPPKSHLQERDLYGTSPPNIYASSIQNRPTSPSDDSLEDTYIDIETTFSLSSSMESLSGRSLSRKRSDLRSKHGSETSSDEALEVFRSARSDAWKTASTDSIRIRVLDGMFEDIRSDLAAARQMRAESFARRASTGGGVLLKQPRQPMDYLPTSASHSSDNCLYPGHLPAVLWDAGLLPEKAQSHWDMARLSSSCPHDTIAKFVLPQLPQHSTREKHADSSGLVHSPADCPAVKDASKPTCTIIRQTGYETPGNSTNGTQEPSRLQNGHNSRSPKLETGELSSRLLCPFAAH